MSQLAEHPAYLQVEDLLDAVGQRYRVFLLLRGSILFLALVTGATVAAALLVKTANHYYAGYPTPGICGLYLDEGAAGILVGLVQTLGGYFFDPAYKYAIVFLLYLLTVWIRPQGLMGW